MLARISRPIAELLREAGIPTAPLPRVALSASGAGKFVLYDSRSVTSALLAKRAKRQGLDPIDISAFATEFGSRLPGWGARDHASPLDQAAMRSFLDQLKLELEIRGGVWLRVGDFPFPFQSTMAIGVEHATDDLADLKGLMTAITRPLTHLVSSRLHADALKRLSAAGKLDLGWSLQSEAFEFSAKKTLAQWEARLARFQQAGVGVRGLSIDDNRLALPARTSLRELGLEYSIRPFTDAVCRTDDTSHHDALHSGWLQFGAVPLPDGEPGALSPERQAAPHRSISATNDPNGLSTDSSHQRIDSAHVLGPDRGSSALAVSTGRSLWLMDWVREHYLSGHPLMIRESAARSTLVPDLQCMADHAALCPLLWQTTFGEFANWWRARRAIGIQVWRSDDAYEIHASGSFGRYPWSIEIWRGAHLATLPLKQSVLSMRDDGLVFLKSQNRSPAGFTVPAAGLLQRASVFGQRSLQPS